MSAGNTELSKVKRNVCRELTMLGLNKSLLLAPREWESSVDPPLELSFVPESENIQPENGTVVDVFEFMTHQTGWPNELCALTNECNSCTDPGGQTQKYKSRCIDCSQPDLGMQASS